MGEKIVTKEQRGPSFVRKIMYHKEKEKERFGIVRQPKEAVRVSMQQTSCSVQTEIKSGRCQI